MAKQNKTTVIFIDNNQKIRKPVLIPTFFLKYWKFFFGGFFVFLGISMYTFVLVIKQYSILQEKEIKSLTKKTEVYSEKLVQQYDFVTEQITEVNNLLKSKGLKEVNLNKPLENPKFNLPSEDINKNLFSQYFKDIKKTISNTPLGSPMLGHISSNFGSRNNPFDGINLENHAGLDIKGEHGTPVKSTANGKVIFAGYKGAYGNLVIVQHGEDFETYYGHLSKILVKENQNIKVNAIIGNVGSTGRSTGPHLHYEIRKSGKTINPQTYLDLN